MAQLLALGGAWLGFRLLTWPGLPGLMGLPGDLSFPARMIILGFIGSLALFPLTPLSAWRSRCHESEADRFASDLTGRPQDLASALVKLSAENLANLFPHPWYAAFDYSHPPAVERVRSLQALTAWSRELPGGDTRGNDRDEDIEKEVVVPMSKIRTALSCLFVLTAISLTAWGGFFPIYGSGWYGRHR